MKTFILSSNQHSAMLYKFVIEHGRSHSEILDPRYRNFEKFLIIGTLDNKLLQVAFTSTDKDSAVTRILGQYSDESIKILNILCAISASHSPEIVNHSFIVPLSNIYNFSQVYTKSRLGMFTDKMEQIDGTIKTHICYPE